MTKQDIENAKITLGAVYQNVYNDYIIPHRYVRTDSEDGIRILDAVNKDIKIALCGLDKLLEDYN